MRRRERGLCNWWESCGRQEVPVVAAEWGEARVLDACRRPAPWLEGGRLAAVASPGALVPPAGPDGGVLPTACDLHATADTCRWSWAPRSWAWR